MFIRTSALHVTLLILCQFIMAQTRVSANDKVRVPWDNTKLVGYPEPPLPYRVVRAYENLPLFNPVYLRAEPGTDRIFFVDHKGDWPEPGGLRVFTDSQDASSSEPLLPSDRIIYGFCFHPNYRENGYLFVISNGPSKDANKFDRITRITIARNGDRKVVDGSELLILEWQSNGHNGGDLAFGPDGYLYCPTGDGTTDSDTLETGQGLNDLLAVMLRLDVDHPTESAPYSIPADNPFINTPGARPEIWAYGFRNPWRMDYDHESNQLWLGQNGQDLWEQVYLIRRGENYGWSVQEGSHPFYQLRPKGAEPIVAPVAEHHHSESRSLTGGVVYRGSKLPDLVGCFIYGDYSTGKIWAIRHDGTKVTFHREIADSTLQITGFGVNHSGELIVVDHGGGFYRVEPTPEQPPTLFPKKLSETGLFASVANHSMVPGVLSYSVNAQLWSDGAHKERWLAVPGEEKIDYTSNRGWNFPNGSALVKSFALEREAGKPETRHWIETRIMLRQDNEWVGYSYRWNDAQTDAELLSTAGMDEEFTIRDPSADGGIRKQTWHYPSRAECMVCHSRAANYVLGLSELQMNRLHNYGDHEANQLQHLSDLGYFKSPLPKPVDELTKLVNPFDETHDIAVRARSYLHANCYNCHIEAGGGNSQFSAEFTATPDQQKLLGARPVHNAFSLPDAALIQPAHPESSVLFHRISQRGPGQMPPIGTNVTDVRAIELMKAWIKGSN
ncbi:MAG: PQQ-dependent sugar dehydrogenase [Planctomycetaceae bacterium]|nr:PQQ-dependent sugar dehydrogenase [Planctomycetaceae bacterium]